MNRAFTLWTHRPFGNGFIRIGEPFTPLDKLDWDGVLCPLGSIACRFTRTDFSRLIQLDKWEAGTGLAKMGRRAA